MVMTTGVNKPMSECTSRRNRELDRIAECMQNARHGIREEYYERRSECVSKAEEKGYEFINSGSNRFVFNIPDSECIVKVATGPHGISANRTEVQVWEDAPPDVKEVLAPVDEGGQENTWITMPEVNTDDRRSALSSFRDKIRKTEWRCKDQNIGNVGHLDGEPVMFDYGEGCGETGIGKRY